MARRTKSIQDIWYQRARIQREIKRRASEAGRTDEFGFPNDMRDISRYGRVKEVADRYLGNINNTKRWQRDTTLFNNASSDAKANKLHIKRVTRQYSQRAYMGLTQG